MMHANQMQDLSLTADRIDRAVRHVFDMMLDDFANKDRETQEQAHAILVLAADSAARLSLDLEPGAVKADGDNVTRLVAANN